MMNIEDFDPVGTDAGQDQQTSRAVDSNRALLRRTLLNPAEELAMQARKQLQDSGYIIAVDLGWHACIDGDAMAVYLEVTDPDDLDIGQGWNSRSI